MKITSPATNRPAEATDANRATNQVALIGNPNSGKTALFNLLTGANFKVGNYPGVTVEKKSGWLKGHKILLQDLPGAYSLSPKSLDEKVTVDLVQSWRVTDQRPKAVVVVLDATNLTRNLFLTLQILEMGVPAIVVLNMMDEVRKQNIRIDPALLQKRLDAYAVIPASAKTGEGIPEIIKAIVAAPPIDEKHIPTPRLKLSDEQIAPLGEVIHYLEARSHSAAPPPLVDSLRMVADDGYREQNYPALSESEQTDLQEKIEQARKNFAEKSIEFSALESAGRYAYINKHLSQTYSDEAVSAVSFSEKVDSIISHTVWGPLILLFVLGFIFNTIFSWAEYPMGWIESAVEWLAVTVSGLLPEGVIQSLLVDGIIVGVGNVVVFLPQIILLIFFLSLLEDSGYITRMAFILDRLMNKLGLQGKAVLPMLSGFACAIPAIMASRTIENWRDRLITILLIPLMSCTARLPVYILLISAFVPQKTFLGFIQLQALVLMGMYFLGFFTAVIISLLIKHLVPQKTISHFVMELPPYRVPMFRSVWMKVYNSGKLFLVNAGSIILAISIILWFLASYPTPNENGEVSSASQVEQSYAGQLGKMIEPVIEPLGFDWKIGVGIIASFAAREVMVSTLATIYNIEAEDDEDIVPLVEAMRNETHPDGRPVYTLLTALSLLVFFVYAAQCMATFAIVKRETNSWRWPLVMIFYMTALAYVASLIVYQGGLLLGVGA